MAGICPCCGNEMSIPSGVAFSPESNTLISSDYAVTFSAYEAKVFDLLWKARNTGSIISKERIFSHLYDMDPNGGPEPKVIEVMIFHIRAKLKNTGIEIACVRFAGYFLRTKTKPMPSRVSGRTAARLQANCGS